MVLRRVSLSLALGALVLAPGVGCSQESVQDQAFGARVRAYLLKHPEVIEEAIGRLEADKEAKAATDQRLEISKNKTALERDAQDFVANAAGRFTVVEFFDYKCPYCKTSAPAVVKMIHDNPDVRFVFKEFPILSDASRGAAADQLLARGEGQYLPIFQDLMAAPALDDQSEAAIFKARGVNLKALATPAARAAVQKHLEETRTLAHEVGVEGTPAFIVDGKKIDGWSPDELKAALDAERRSAGARPA